MKNFDVDVEANNPSSAHKSQSSEGCMLCTFLWTFLSIMLFIIFVAVPVANYENLHETTCNVTRVDYPTTLPVADYETDTVEDSERDWAECDCGRRCMSWTPCIRIYQDDTMIREYVNSAVFAYSDCSFNNYSCPNGEDIRLINQTLTEAIALAESYIGFNGTCFANNEGNLISLTNILDLGNIIGFSLLLFIMLICFFFACRSCSRSNLV